MFDPRLEGVVDLTSVAVIKNDIDKKFVLENYMTEEFCDFVLNYAAVVSHPKDQLLKQLRAAKCNKTIFQLVSLSDISYSFTIYVNNHEYWAWSHGNDKRKAANLKKQEQRKSNKRGRIGDDEAASDKAPKQWGLGNRSKKFEWGLPPEGRALYITLKKALKDVGVQAWDEVWKKFWDKEVAARPTDENPKKKRKVDDGDDNEDHDEDDYEDVEELDMSDSDDDDDDDGGGGEGDFAGHLA